MGACKALRSCPSGCEGRGTIASVTDTTEFGVALKLLEPVRECGGREVVRHDPGLHVIGKRHGRTDIYGRVETVAFQNRVKQLGRELGGEVLVAVDSQERGRIRR